MRSFSINRTDLDFLLARLRESSLLARLENAKDAGPIPSRSTTERFPLTLTEEELSLLNDVLLDLFCSIGLEPDSEPNAVGRYIEGLIDFFGIDVE